MNPEVYGYLFPKLLDAGALDVFLTQIIMKKSRPGVKLSVLCRDEQCRELETMIFKETTTLGIRRLPVQRSMLQRQHASVRTRYGPVTVKMALENQELLKYAPEYEDCRRQAELHGVPLREVYQAAMAAAEQAGLRPSYQKEQGGSPGGSERP